MGVVMTVSTVHLLIIYLHELAVHAVVNQPSDHRNIIFIISSSSSSSSSGMSSGAVGGICRSLQHGKQFIGASRDHAAAT
jgi:hypothetical protein